MATILLPFLLLWSFLALCQMTIGQPHSFLIDYPNNRFLKDGYTYRYISGSIHYFRIPTEYWQDRLLKMKAAGLNAIECYVPWNVHEPYEGEFNFQNNANLLGFLQLAQGVGLDVILRMGPYTCGEWEAGGHPWWLYKIPNLAVRTSDPRYLFFVDRFYAKLMPMLTPYLYKNGGPIIIMQVENEYGSRPYCDGNYTGHLRDLFRSYVGQDFVLITVDGGALSYLVCGYIPGVYPTVDFGTGSRDETAASFGAQRAYAPHGPLVNTEFYPGWLDLWGTPHSVVPTPPIIESMYYMYQMGASFNFYMFEGGTNFGYMNGASDNHSPVTTSYDYDAPLSEAGDPTEKYLAIRQAIQNLTGIPITMPVPPALPKIAYGTVPVSYLGQVTDLLDQLCPPHNRIRTILPKTFEDINFPYGFILYETLLNYNGQGQLAIPGINDRGYVMLDGVYQGRVTISDQQKMVQIYSQSTGTRLQILVENNGRLTNGVPDLKGIQGNVTLNGYVLIDWLMYPLNLENIFEIIPSFRNQQFNGFLGKSQPNGAFAPSIYFTKFTTNNIADTYFDPSNWGKGQVLINNFNVGRYWPSLGPQVTLYIPRSVISTENYLVMFELESPGNCQDAFNTVCNVNFLDFPILNKTITASNFRNRPFRH